MNAENKKHFDLRVLGEMAWQAACDKAKYSKLTVHPITLIADALAEGERTAREFRKGHTKYPGFDQVLSLLREFKSADMYDYFLAAIKNAYESNEDAEEHR